ncbi:hypothetical protein F3Y22_tig00110221pilonHSYRG00177 [Hibiscus syriacus]|uniref:Uncharacterized protein n=1 Tax=Hibiscus syriacus TaxID=106335 RepID=A0A6A3BDR5_HIBSY|nr:hypothetical protein F3Y22_tig00110221pilonHSYRG00177 [Hibiscus syriacus]
MGINLKDARVEVEKIIRKGTGFVVVEIPFTPIKCEDVAARVLENPMDVEEHEPTNSDNAQVSGQRITKRQRKAIWIFVGSDLRRDLDDIGAACIEVHALSKFPYSKLDSRSVGINHGFKEPSDLSLESGAANQIGLCECLHWKGIARERLATRVYGTCIVLHCMELIAYNLLYESLKGQGSFHGMGIVMIMRDAKIGEDGGELGIEEEGLGIAFEELGIFTYPAREEARMKSPISTVKVERMGNIDDVFPFFGKGFNKIYPLIMVVYTLLLVTNFFDRVIKYFGNWKMFRFQNEADGTGGFDPSGLIILQKERAMLEGGYKVCEHVIPLSRNFSGNRFDKEHGSNSMYDLIFKYAIMPMTLVMRISGHKIRVLQFQEQTVQLNSER